MTMKIFTILGTRPEIIRLSSIIKKLDKNFNHILVNTGQNFDNNLNKIFFSQFNWIIKKNIPEFMGGFKRKLDLKFTKRQST